MEYISSHLAGCCLAILLLNSISPISSDELINGKILTGHKKQQLTINKVTLTQKGYIQFLRYIADVPTLYDFTFCIWVRSHNLTHSHPLLSYSLHEEQRLIRSWISPLGKTANLAIREHLVFKIPVNIKENHWNHICQSWETKSGTWGFFLNGKLKGSGHEPKLRGIKIPAHGDLVVGQEYTDFDKGLDDGIEGDIFGFNFVLAPATTTTPEIPYKERDYILPRPNYNEQYHTILPEASENIDSYNQDGIVAFPKSSSSSDLQNDEAEEISSAVGYFSSMAANRDPKMMSFFNNFFNTGSSLKPMRYQVPPHVLTRRRTVFPSRYRPIMNRRVFAPSKLYLNDVIGQNSKPLGLVLVELGYQNCAFGRGAPIDDEKVLVSWTKTPVRVFGGAILKSIPPFCT